jgi:5,10-methylenetetrahydromethanopterin reductase
MSRTTRAARLGGYVLPGGPSDIRPVVVQAEALEAAGVGGVYLGERYATKDLPSIAGALSQVTSTVRLIGAVTHIGTRHPMVLASMGQTLQALSGNRFVLGFGRGSAGRWSSYGIAAPTSRGLADTADILRRLWAGERVSYDGPAGTFPDLALMELAPVTPPPLLLAGVGPKTLDLAGASFDGAILHPLLTPEAVARSAARVRTAAERAGRDAEQLEVHATVIVAPDGPANEVIGARGLGYLLVAGLGESIVAVNGWDPAALAAIRAHDRFTGLAYHQLKSVPVAELAAVSEQLPPHWLTDGVAAGTAAQCAARVDDYLDAGATHVLLHGLDHDATTRFMAAYLGRHLAG